MSVYLLAALPGYSEAQNIKKSIMRRGLEQRPFPAYTVIVGNAHRGVLPHVSTTFDRGNSLHDVLGKK